MSRPLLSAVAQRSHLLTQRLLSHHVLLQEFMPNDPVMQASGKPAARHGSRPARRILAALPLDILRPESEEARGNERGDPFPQETESAEREAVALISPAESELQSDRNRTVESSPLLQEPSPTPQEAEEAPAVSQEAETTRPSRRPWKQRIVEVDTAAETASGIPTPVDETARVSKEPPETVKHLPSAMPQDIPSTVRRPNRESRTQRPAEMHTGSEREAASPENGGETNSALPAIQEEPASPEADVPLRMRRSQPLPLEFKADTNVVQTDEKRSVLGEQPERDPAATELFADEGQDRSPQAWVARLQGVNRPASPRHAPTMPAGSAGAEPVATATARPDPYPFEAPVPISEPNRRFLQPLVGMDPVAARIHLGPVAEQATAALNAEALTSGEDIFLGAGHDADTPEGLGLLAHELTHVARNRSQDFIPPITIPDPASEGAKGLDVIAPMSEESLALKVEAGVRHAARQAALEPPVTPIGAPAFESAAKPKGLTGDKQAAETVPGSTAAVSATGTPEESADTSPWSGLPAPWEPLPAWIAPQPTALPVEAQSAVGSPADSDRPGPEIQLAGTERHVDEPSEGTHQGSAPAAHAAPEPDLDRLAQQVYTRLKQRLAAERRREWR